MAHSRSDNPFNPSSPRSSSGGADSFKGTPDTRLTTFSPGCIPLESKSSSSVSGTPSVQLPVHASRDGSLTDKDPFVTPTHEVPLSQLSPTASTFSPFTTSFHHPFPTSLLTVATTLSTDIGVSRHLGISAPSNVISVGDVDNWLNGVEVKGAKFHGTRRLAIIEDHRVLAYFSDIRDACLVHASIHLADQGWVSEYIIPAHITKDILASFDQTSAPNGQVSVFASISPGCIVDGFWAIESVRTLLGTQGQVFALARRCSFPDGSFKAIVEFCDASAALAVVTTRNNTLTSEGIHLTVALRNHESDSVVEITHGIQGMTTSSVRDSPNHSQRLASRAPSQRPMLAPPMRLQPSIAMYPFLLQSPIAPTIPYMVDRMLPGIQNSPANSCYSVDTSVFQGPPSPALTVSNSYSPSKTVSGPGRSDNRRQYAARMNRTPYHNVVGHHNHVDIHRIREGTDVRTTIMLRNIPNKVDQAMLKRIIDESSWGKYDFMYLRIDFANDCNVGYAFINFVDPLDIIDFVEARGNQRWNCFKSDKVAEISYATIQGKDCLVQKFRNSSVMLEAPHYRPKLYFTSNGPMPELAGQEETFPEPDNQSKMKRSCENAEHVGLFTPNAGQHFRDEQRRRRSQYDRGTRLAALEEYDYDTTLQHLYSASS
ncbi:RNA recognition motif 2-domain-containing protein [Stachybotrys elegans]|uniref:RNA recognition motif 2-domain-containing protein n=1 Tax=Stachybotrys elegans TaxID=80388 RepID=A0A8K0SFA6_9HYPO|nr:RNA recognition motif 2-domain-containing protein [Stachybotrys elegans]